VVVLVLGVRLEVKFAAQFAELLLRFVLTNNFVDILGDLLAQLELSSLLSSFILLHLGHRICRLEHVMAAQKLCFLLLLEFLFGRIKSTQVCSWRHHDLCSLFIFATFFTHFICNWWWITRYKLGIIHDISLLIFLQIFMQNPLQLLKICNKGVPKKWHFTSHL